MFLIPTAPKNYNWKKLQRHEGGDKMNYEQFENRKKTMEALSPNTEVFLFLQKSFCIWYIFSTD